MGTNLRFFKIFFHDALFRPIVGYRRRALYQAPVWSFGRSVTG